MSLDSKTVILSTGFTARKGGGNGRTERTGLVSKREGVS